MKAVLAAAPLTHTSKLQEPPATCCESEDGKNCCRLHDASHFAQSNHSIRKKMQGATTKSGVEKGISEGKGLDSGTGEMHVGSAFLCDVSCALPEHPRDTSIPNTSFDGEAIRRP